MTVQKSARHARKAPHGHPFVHHGARCCQNAQSTIPPSGRSSVSRSFAEPRREHLSITESAEQRKAQSKRAPMPRRRGDPLEPTCRGPAGESRKRGSACPSNLYRTCRSRQPMIQPGLQKRNIHTSKQRQPLTASPQPRQHCTRHGSPHPPASCSRPLRREEVCAEPRRR